MIKQILKIFSNSSERLINSNSFQTIKTVINQPVGFGGLCMVTCHQFYEKKNNDIRDNLIINKLKIKNELLELKSKSFSIEHGSRIEELENLTSVYNSANLENYSLLSDVSFRILNGGDSFIQKGLKDIEKKKLIKENLELIKENESWKDDFKAIQEGYIQLSKELEDLKNTEFLE